MTDDDPETMIPQRNLGQRYAPVVADSQWVINLVGKTGPLQHEPLRDACTSLVLECLVDDLGFDEGIPWH